ncbi:MAG: cytidine deaminase [Flavobacteriales bacterium]|nr:cytidine deaminase [Flavobacteriales bacterium]
MGKSVQTLGFHYETFDSLDELPADEVQLVEAAREAAESAYAPYSRYHVGAALRLSGGRMVIGSNQENVAYPSGLCAERVAFFAAGAQFPGKTIEKVAIIALSEDFDVNEPVAPCGACRQSMSEYEFKQDTPIRLLLASASGKIIAINSVNSLLPLVFNESKLKKPL